MTASAPGDIARRYGLDWLRIGAFALLIFYHIGMFFVPWGWHIKSATPVEWLELPMLGLNAWRLPLLFVISGVASRFLIGKRGAFGRSRTGRLLPALLFGSFVIVAPQAWVDLTVNHGYTQPFGWFYVHDYFSFSNRLGIILPTWNHLWFVAYLLVYSWILALVLMLPASTRAALQRGFDRLLAGPWLFITPALYFLACGIVLNPLFPETHALIDDWDAHAVYFGCFVFGVGIAKSHGLWRSIDARWPVYAAISLAGYAFVLFVHLNWPHDVPPLGAAAYEAARMLQGLGAILALLGFANTHWHHDSAARRYLTEAVFPYYIAHQTIIIVVAYWLRPYALGNGISFAILATATVAGCALFYEIARRTGPLRPLFGLARVPSASRSAAAGAVAPAG